MQDVVAGPFDELDIMRFYVRPRGRPMLVG